jgi:hypothetical protein
MIEYDEDNIFAKILRGEIPCTRVYEDEEVLAFLDIMPVNPGHTLVISKTEKAALVENLSPHALAAIVLVGKKVGHALRNIRFALRRGKFLASLMVRPLGRKSPMRTFTLCLDTRGTVFT